MTAKQLFQENMKFAYFYLNKHLPSKAFDEDIQQIALMALWKACLYFDPEKGTAFTTLASNCLFNDLTNHLRGNRKKWGNTILFTDYEIFDNKGRVFNERNLLESIEEADDPIGAIDTYDTITELFDETEQKIFDMLVEGKTQIEIGKEIGCSYQYISQKIKRMKLKAIVTRSRTNEH